MVTWSTPTLGKLQMPWVHIGHIKYGDFKDISNGDTTSKSMNRLHFVERGSSKAKKNRLLIFCTGWISLPHICYIYTYLYSYTPIWSYLSIRIRQKERREREIHQLILQKTHEWQLIYTFRLSNLSKFKLKQTDGSSEPAELSRPLSRKMRLSIFHSSIFCGFPSCFLEMLVVFSKFTRTLHTYV